MTTSSTRYPYGVYNFPLIVNEGLFFVDNSNVIKKLENASKHVLLCRPPRFGKSLLLSMLRLYYDEQKAPLFDKLFGHLWIGRNPTGNQNKYKVLHMDLSVSADEEDSEDSKKCANERFSNEINRVVKEFRERYELSFEIDDTDFTSSLEAMCTALEKTSSRLLVLIDEYDNWANQLLIDGGTLRSSESLKSKLSPLSRLFTQLKKFQNYVLPDFRTVTVGISVLPLADISGWNIYKDLTHESEFATALGFAKADVRSALQALHVADATKEKKLLYLLHIFFNGYDFAAAGKTVFNPQQIVYFCECYREKKLDGFVPDASACDSWSLERSIAFLDKCTDQKAVLSDTVVDVIVTSPHCTLGLLRSLARENAAQSLKMISRGKLTRLFRVHDVMTDEDGLIRFMLHNGMVTLAQVLVSESSSATVSESSSATVSESSSATVDESLCGLRVPNQLVLSRHFEALMQRLEKEKDLLGKFWREPRAATLQQLLDDIMSNTTEQLSSSRLTEEELRFGLCLALRQMCRRCSFKTANVRAHVICEPERIDLLLMLPEQQKLAIVELKRLLCEHIDFGKQYSVGDVGTWGGEQTPAGDNEACASEKNQAQAGYKISDRNAKTKKKNQTGDLVGEGIVGSLSLEQLRSLALSGNGKAHFNGALDVMAVLRSAKEQAKRQKAALRKNKDWDSYHTVYRFVAVQVLKPLLVEQVENE